MSLKLVPSSPPLYEEATAKGPLRSCEIAVINCAMANGFSSTMLFGTPLVPLEHATTLKSASVSASSNSKSSSASSQA
jgi:hypothetical protein